MPIATSAKMGDTMVKAGALTEYECSKHGLAQIEVEQFDTVVLAFITG